MRESFALKLHFLRVYPPPFVPLLIYIHALEEGTFFVFLLKVKSGGGGGSYKTRI